MASTTTRAKVHQRAKTIWQGHFIPYLEKYGHFDYVTNFFQDIYQISVNGRIGTPRPETNKERRARMRQQLNSN